ncbi:MAG: M48 family metalloprotease [Deltaproteobacteria bacterium]|nr:M48 family metalloprotease [Deltaproteobacteria bacterium]
MVLNSGTLQVLDDGQLRYVLVHELGHVLSGHVLYKTMLGLLLRGDDPDDSPWRARQEGAGHYATRAREVGRRVSDLFRKKAD